MVHVCGTFVAFNDGSEWRNNNHKPFGIFTILQQRKTKISRIMQQKIN